MNAGTHEALWRRLADAAIVQGEAPAPSIDAGPWYIGAMMGAAAWIAAVFLLAFIGMALHDLVRTDVAKVVAGVVLCAGAAVAVRPATGVFVGQLGLAASLTGQALFAFGVMGMFRVTGIEGATGAFIVAAFEAVLALAVPNVVHRVIATAAAALALAWGLWLASLGTLGLVVAAALFVIVELDDRRLARFPRALPAIGVGIALAIVAILPVQVAADEFWFWRDRDAMPILGRRFADAAMGAVFFGAAWWMIARSGVTRASAAHVGAVVGALALAAVSVWVPGLSAALLILLVGFATGQRLLTGGGALALLAALSRYYYALSAPLLAKSAALLVTAVVLLALWYALRRAGGTTKEDRHA